MDVQDEEDQFRIYSDRTIDASIFAWSPYMDLLAVLPCDPSNMSVSVYRLINDKQSGSALLFSEKIPFTASCVSWVPDKRSLAIGDVAGNVFVYDAERQRSVELQRVHECRIASMSWVAQGLSASFDFSNFSGASKLPNIYATPITVAQLVGEVGSGSTSDANVDESERLVNDSLAKSDKATFLTVMGENGRIQIYYGGSIPVAEFSVPGLFGSINTTNFTIVSMSENFKTVAALAQGSEVYLINTGLLYFKKKEIARVCKLESDLHWLLKQLSVSVGAINRAVQSSLEEFDNQIGQYVVGDLEDLKAGKNFSSSLSAAKVTKLGRSTLLSLDFMTSTLLTRVGVILDHITLVCCELSDSSESQWKYSVLGLIPSLCDDILAQARKMVVLFEKKLNSVQKCSISVRALQFWLESALDVPAAQRLVPSLSEKDKTAETEWNSKLEDLSDFSDLLKESKSLETYYVQLLSHQRRSIASRIAPLRVIAFPQEEVTCMRWAECSEDQLEMCWTKRDLLVYVSVNTLSGEIQKRLEFSAPTDSVWRSPQFYKSDKICVLLIHANSTSICLLTFTNFFSSSFSQLSPSEYGFPSSFVAQQLPHVYAQSSVLEVSSERGLASAYTAEGRMITLDLEKCDDENNVEEEEEESSISVEPAKTRRKKDLKRIDSILDESSGENQNMMSNASTPKEENPARSLKFYI